MTEKYELLTINQVGSDLQITDEFKKLIEMLPIIVTEAKTILEKPIETLTEDELIESQKEVTDITAKYKRSIEDGLSLIKATYNNSRDTTVKAYTSKLSEAGYDELQDILKEIKERKTMILERRKSERWNEVKDHFNKVLSGDAYAQVREKFPNITFDTFYNQNKSLIKGAKDFKVSKNVLQVVTDFIVKLNDDLNTIQALNSPFEMALFDKYQTVLNVPDVITHNTSLIHQAEMAKKRELDKLANQKKELDAANKRKEDAAKLLKKEPVKASTVNFEKLLAIYPLVQQGAKDINNAKPDQYEDIATTVINKVRDILK